MEVIESEKKEVENYVTVLIIRENINDIIYLTISQVDYRYRTDFNTNKWFRIVCKTRIPRKVHKCGGLGSQAEIILVISFVSHTYVHTIGS